MFPPFVNFLSNSENLFKLEFLPVGMSPKIDLIFPKKIHPTAKYFFFEVQAKKIRIFPQNRGGGYSRITSPWQIKYGESRGSTHKEILPQRLIIKNPGPPCLTIMVTAVYSVTSRVNEFEEKKMVERNCSRFYNLSL